MFCKSLKFCLDDVVRFPAYDLLMRVLIDFHNFFASMSIHDTSCIGTQNYFMLGLLDGVISRLSDIVGK